MAFFKPCAPQLLLLLVEGRRPGLRPGGRLTFFVSPKKVSKERRPDVHALLRRVRCAAQLGRGLAKLAALKQTRALFPPKSALLAVPDGRWGAGTDGCCCAATPLCFTRRARLLRSAVRCQRSAQHNQHRSTSVAGCTTGTDFVSAFASSPAPDPACPVGQGRAAECQVDKGSRLFERSEFSETPPGASSAGNHEVALTSGRLSLLTFFGEAKKVRRPPGRNPGLRPETKSRTSQAQQRHKPQKSSLDEKTPPSPNPSQPNGTMHSCRTYLPSSPRPAISAPNRRCNRCTPSTTSRSPTCATACSASCRARPCRAMCGPATPLCASTPKPCRAACKTPRSPTWPMASWPAPATLKPPSPGPTCTTSTTWSSSPCCCRTMASSWRWAPATSPSRCTSRSASMTTWKAR